jgi:membrane-bound serine protease (ClpP class)
MNPALQGIFIMLMVGGIYFELQTPGIGFPLAAAVVGAMLYFAPLYLEGIANHWEILVFVLGIILIGLEVFVIPGFGITGISGIVLVVLGLSLSMVDAVSLHEMGTLNLAPLGNAMLLVLLSILIAVGLVFAFAPSLFRSKAFRNLVLVKAQTTTEGYLSVDAAEHDKVGKTAIVATDLRPSGKIELDGELFDAQSFGDYIPRGQKVIIVKFGQGQLYVKKQV